MGASDHFLFANPPTNQRILVLKMGGRMLVNVGKFLYILDKILISNGNYRRLNMIGRERANGALIGCDSQ